jgi:hypothetical protein
MSKVFVDTVAWLALLNVNDTLYAQAQQVMSSLQRKNVRLVTTEFALLEVADVLSTPHLRPKTINFINGLRQLPHLQIVPASQKLFMTGWTLYSQRIDKEWGLTDCISFVVMFQKEITQAFTSDHHFVQAGFTKLLSL